MLIDNIRPGDLVEIVEQSIKHEVPTYKSKVEAVIDRESVLVHIPISKGRDVHLEIGTNHFLHFISDRGVFRFRSTVDAYLKIDGFQIIRFILLDKGERTQRRDFFRFNCAMAVKFAIINKENGEDRSAEMLDGLIRDLGGGGMKMFSAHQVAEKSFIRIMLELNDDYIMIFGEMLHRRENKDGMLPYQYGVKFAAMSKSDQEKIIQFLYMEQRKALQKAR